MSLLRRMLTYYAGAELETCPPATNTGLYPDGKFPDFSSRGRQQKRVELRRAAFARVCDRQARVTDRSVQFPFGVTRRERRKAARIVVAVVWEQSQQLTANNAQVGDVL